MSGADDPNKPVSLYDSSPSNSQPLLSKPPYPLIEDSPLVDRPDSDPTQYLHISYNYGPRHFKDIPFVLLFLLFVLCTFGFGIFATIHKNDNYSTVSSFTYDINTTSCVKDSLLVSVDNGVWFIFSSSTSSSSTFVKDLIWTLVITLILSVPICLALLFLLKHYTKQIVYAALPFFIVIPVFLDVYWFVACTVSSRCSDAFPLVYRIIVLLFVLLIIGIIVWIFVINWHRIELTVRIIGVASCALSKNLGLLLVLPSLTISLLLYYSPIVVFLVLARLNGKIVAREYHGQYSCVWKQDAWVPAYFALAILTMLWSAAFMVEAKVFVISGTIAQWYFSKEYNAPSRTIKSSLRNAFGPSSGTICLSGLLIFVVRVVRAAVDSARHEDAPGIVNLILRCCANALLSAVDFLNKFTINFAAITGEAYCSSARMTYELLRRNLLSAVFVETISTRLMAGIGFVLSAIYAIATCAILKAVSNLGTDSYFMALLAWLLLIVILGFFVHVLDNVIDTIYVCYAIDRDRGDVSKQEVHDIYVHLPISRSQRHSLPVGTLV